jgi:arylsulfatase A-like enzyme
MDFVPMLLNAAGLALPADRVLDGMDPTATLAGQAPSPHKYLYWRWGAKSAAIRMGPYKLIREQQSTNQDWQLFDLQTDIGESANLLAAKPELAEHLKAEYERWEMEATGER